MKKDIILITSKPSLLLMGFALVAGLILALAALPLPACAASPPPASDTMHGQIEISSQRAEAIPNQAIRLRGCYRGEARRDLCKDDPTAYRWMALNNQDEEPFQIYLIFPAVAAVLFLCGRLLARRLRR